MSEFLEENRYGMRILLKDILEWHEFYERHVRKGKLEREAK